MAFRGFDQENQLPAVGATRFAPRRDQNGDLKAGLSVVSSNVENMKRVQPGRQGKKAAPFTILDENAIDEPFKTKKEASTCVVAGSQFTKLKDRPVVLQQQQKTVPCAELKAPRQPLVAINLRSGLEDSACSSIDTSLHQSDFVLQASEFYKDVATGNDLSPMVVDCSLSDDCKPFASVSEYNRHLESALPECYLADIYRYLRECEERHRPKPHYMRKQADITPGMRSILIDWLVEVAEEYKLQNETLYLAVSFIDRFLSHMSVLRGKLQLVGTAAMFIASKYEEIYPPEVSEFVYITDDTYTKKQVLRNS